MRSATHPRKQVRLAAVKALARLQNRPLLPFYTARLQRESATLMRHELVSAVWRLHLSEAIPLLAECLQNPNPKVVLQAVRASLCFGEQNYPLLQPLREHPNELVRAAVDRALTRGKREPPSQPHPHSPDALKNLIVCGDAWATNTNQSRAPTSVRETDFCLFAIKENHIAARSTCWVREI